MANTTIWASLEIPALEVAGSISFSVLTAAIDIPALEISGSISQDQYIHGSLELPALEVAGRFYSGGLFYGAVKIPVLRVAGSIAHENQISGDISFPALKISGSIRHDGLIHGSIELPDLRISGNIQGERIVYGNIDLPALRITGSIQGGNLLYGSIELPALVIAGTIIHDSTITGAIELGFMEVSGEFRNIVATVPFRRGFAMNLSHFGVTEYNNYSFNSLTNYMNSGIYIGASENGIFLLEGNRDNGNYIEGVLQTGTEDLWKQFTKRLREGIMVMRGGPISIQLELDEGRLDPITVMLTSVLGTSHEEIVKLPRGLKNRFISFIIKNLSGNDFDLEEFKVFCDRVGKKR